MDFTITDKMQTILDMINEFVEKELFPLEPYFSEGDFKEALPMFEEKRDMVKKMELWAPNLPKELGGIRSGSLYFRLPGPGCRQHRDSPQVRFG